MNKQDRKTKRNGNKALVLKKEQLRDITGGCKDGSGEGDGPCAAGVSRPG